ncbi:hypothetical protein ACOBQX_14460 [Actinokineospora sp. G85]|uniref:sunset domain-containing protein n=1 Tax=Actinokineospora sp. G85 TaxID=3406626 RepID=UPI003C738FB1
MPFFGQVWVWSLAGFLVGALLCWLLIANPARKRAAVLADTLADLRRKQAADETGAVAARDEHDDRDQDGYGRDEFDDHHRADRDHDDRDHDDRDHDDRDHDDRDHDDRLDEPEHRPADATAIAPVPAAEATTFIPPTRDDRPAQDDEYDRDRGDLAHFGDLSDLADLARDREAPDARDTVDDEDDRPRGEHDLEADRDDWFAGRDGGPRPAAGVDDERPDDARIDGTLDVDDAGGTIFTQHTDRISAALIDSLDESRERLPEPTAVTEPVDQPDALDDVLQPDDLREPEQSAHDKPLPRRRVLGQQPDEPEPVAAAEDPVDDDFDDEALVDDLDGDDDLDQDLDEVLPTDRGHRLAAPLLGADAAAETSIVPRVVDEPQPESQPESQPEPAPQTPPLPKRPPRTAPAAEQTTFTEPEPEPAADSALPQDLSASYTTPAPQRPGGPLPKRTPAKPRTRVPFGVQTTAPGGQEPPLPAAVVAEIPPEPDDAQGTRERSLFEPIVPVDHQPAKEPVAAAVAAAPQRRRGGRTPNTTGIGGVDPFVPPGPFGPGSAMPLPGGRPPSSEFTIKASVTALRYCSPESPKFDRTVAEVWFRSVDDAERVGFRPLP